ncbi:MAG: hypothetical protein HOP19_25835 [Acidobacteria bacterium]|nr:hypothetical protein [Acidobacteriota bacterium]
MRVRRSFLFVWCGLSTWLSLALWSFAVTETEMAASSLRYRGGVHNAFSKRALKPKQLQTLLKSLRAHSGWPQLDFDADGFLVCPDEAQFNSGSAAARKLLSAAMDAPMAFDLESHTNTANVAFARLDVPAHFRSMASGRQINVYPVQFDFADFAALRGETEVVAAFDIGLVFMHELAHGVWSLRDALSDADALGECERYINQIRRELNLPERQHYAARTRSSGVSVAGGVAHYAELLFRRNDARKPAHYYLQWDAQRVGRT